jgi:predicted outer membrane repeat protein
LIREFNFGSAIGGVSKVVVRDCEFRDCKDATELLAGALDIQSVEEGEVRRCTFVDNSSTRGVPGGEYLGGGGALSVEVVYWGNFTIAECLFLRNEAPSGGAVYAAGQITFTRNTVVDNRSGDGAAFLATFDDSKIYNNVFAWNRPYGLYDWSSTGQTKCSCNAFWEDRFWWGLCTGLGPNDDRDEISEDPGFCGPEYDDFHLMDDSPLLPENYPDDIDFCKGIIGALEAGCGPPPPATLPTSWGQIKARYRN